MTDKSQLNEFKSDDKQSEVPEPVATGDKKRPADKSEGEKAIPQFATKVEAMNAAVSAFAGLSTHEISDFLAGLGKEKNKRPLDKDTKILPKMTKEDVEAVFGQVEGLDEEAISRVITIFEAALNMRVSLEEQALKEDFENRLLEAVEEIRTELTEEADKYITAAAEKWLSENKVEAQNSIRVQLAEAFMADIRNVFTSHGMILPENIDVVADMSARIEDLTNRLAEADTKSAEDTKTIREYQMAEAFLEISEGLTVTQVDKLEQLIEGLDFANIDEFTNKLTVIKETYFDKTAPSTKSLTEEVVIEEETAKPVVTNSAVSGYASRLARQARS